MCQSARLLVMLAVSTVALPSFAQDSRRLDIVPPSMEVLNERYHYSPAVRVGNLLFVAGQVGRNKNLKVIEGKERQLVQAFENLQTVLSEAGADFDDIVEIVTYHTNMEDLPLVLKVKDRYFKNRFPAWTALEVKGLSMPELEFEIKATAYLEKQ
jgi:enamine deaminase RidA (YjgF/YER057c/UK114 family)